MDQLFLLKLTEAIQANIGDSSFGAEELSRFMGMSHTNLLRKVRSTTGKSINQLIREIRLNKAWEMMKTEGANVNEVAYKLGFSSPSYFNTCFREHFGYPPGEVRKMQAVSPVADSIAASPAASGLSAETDSDGEKKLQVKKLTRRILIVGLSGLLVVFIGLILFTILSNSGRSISAMLDKQGKSIAVMPFKSLSDDPGQQYQAEGLMEDIHLNLSNIRELRVIPSASVEKYLQTGKTIKKMGQELNVAYILTGKYQRIGESFRLTVELIRTKSEDLVWNDKFDRQWKDVFSVQSEVSQTIAEKINVFVSPEEKMVIETVPTSDPTAYDYYILGKNYQNRSYKEEDIRNAILMYQKATKTDPNYSLAWTGLACCSRLLFLLYFDRSNQNLSLAEQYLNRALALSPRLKEVRTEEAWFYYHCKHNYSKSLTLLEKLKTDYPSESEIYFTIGAVNSRLRDFRNAMENMDHAIRLNPSDWRYKSQAAITFEMLHDYRKAEEYYNKAIEINPSSGPYGYLFGMYIRTGQLKKARDFLNAHKDVFGSKSKEQARLDIIDRNYDKAIQFYQSFSEDPISSQAGYYTKHMQLGLLYRLVPDSVMAIRQFQIERDLLLKKITGSENDDRLYISLGVAYAGLSMKEQALEAGRKALKILDSLQETLYGYAREYDMVRILLMLGEYDDAMIKLDQIMKNHDVFWSSASLNLDPFWDPVRNHPKFREIISNPEYQVNLTGN